ncbi:B-cell lymphoma/leukemia 11A-like isoform X2 [Acanthaster planci]|uniref:B-cell lymphoma/leukemia 11A-like isoform X2 n=1 Tax=Acanthaster planci TaxID=133434 RepID=A0A8B7XKM8_ACAPL|nr:B-cell lymphoma/leukemia 11A-like isoform X2 [Acanthaster planci]
MSRRKQDNPQQLRRSLDDEDESQGILEGEEAPPFDLIKCGECNADFALADIVKFIEHKRKCYPRVDPMQLMASSTDAAEEMDEVGLRKTETEEGKREGEEQAKEEERAVAITDVVVRTEKPKIITPIKRISSSSSVQRDPVSPRVKQTQTQTAEPDQSKTYICCSCKDIFDDAVSLLEHVQCDHGMQIYQQPWKTRDSNSTVSESSSHSSGEAKTSRKTYSPQSPDSDVKLVMPSVSTTPSSSSAPPLPPSHPPLPPALPIPPASSVAAPPAHHQPPLLVHSPHAHHAVHPLEGSSLSVYMHPPAGEQHILPERMYAGPINPTQCMTLRDVLATERANLNSHMLMTPQGFDRSSHPTFSSTNTAIDMDMYSQRLRELAAAGPMNPPKKKSFHYPIYSPRFKSPFSPKVKACEFCGKTFKFQSNLIVHRRSHTGEKPYKCQLCDHACSQASKLKRHMKTHINKPPSTLTSPSSGPNLSDDGVSGETSASSLIKTAVDRYMSETKFSNKDTSIDGDENEDDEEEEEGEEEEMEGEDEEEEMEEISSDEANIGERSSDTDGLPQSSHRDDNHDEKENHSSLLSEVMKHTGLSEIQQYSEAYQQAVAERYRTSRRHSSRLEQHMVRERQLKEPRSGDSTLLREVLAGPSYHSPEKERSPTRSPRNAMSGLEEVTKRIKVEPPSTTWGPEPSNFPSKDPYNQSPVLMPSQSSPSASATNGTVPSYYSGSNSTGRPAHSSPSSSMPYSSLALHKSPKELAIDRRTGTCEFCGKVFKNCSNLTVHRRSHTGEKPYKCELCPYACAQSSKLTRHMKTHGQGAKEVFKCEVCGMPFSVYSTLEKHMKKSHWGNIRGTTR